MSNHDQDDRQELIDFLRSHGWDDQKANRFLDDQVGVRRLQIPGRCLLDVLREVCQEGIPISDESGGIWISFLVPSGNWEAFKQRAEAAIAKHGGFLLTSEEGAALSQITPKLLN